MNLIGSVEIMNRRAPFEGQYKFQILSEVNHGDLKAYEALAKAYGITLKEATGVALKEWIKERYA